MKLEWAKEVLPIFQPSSDREHEAAYLKLHRSGGLRERVEVAESLLEDCSVCPRACGVNRIKGELGMCRTSCGAIVSSYGAHFGEEAPLVGCRGSGTIFFGNCNLKCVFCQTIP